MGIITIKQIQAININYTEYFKINTHKPQSVI